jgi:hypothetical protein
MKLRYMLKIVLVALAFLGLVYGFRAGGLYASMLMERNEPVRLGAVQSAPAPVAVAEMAPLASRTPAPERESKTKARRPQRSVLPLVLALAAGKSL